MARPASESALASASEIASSASRAASSSDWPCARRVCSASSSDHSSAPGASFATSPICQASRSRSRSRSPCFSRASASDCVAARQADQSAASGAASICACASSRARTAGARVSPCQACWPWMSTSSSAASRSCAIVAPLPLIHARLLPCASIVRRSSMRPASPASASKPASASHGASAGGTSNSALTSARAAPSRTTPASPRLPSASWSASTRIDLPAPVSPLSTVNPDENSISSASTMTKSRIARRCSIGYTPDAQCSLPRSVA